MWFVVVYCCLVFSFVCFCFVVCVEWSPVVDDLVLFVVVCRCCVFVFCLHALLVSVVV